MPVLIFRNIAVFFFFFGLIGNASWGFISTREAFLIDCIYGIMFFSSPFMILVSYIIPFTKKRYFSITFILAFLMLLSFINAINYPYPDRGKESQVHSNMYKLQTELETYSIDWKNIYPENYKILKTEAEKYNYNKTTINPYSKTDTEAVIMINDLPKEPNPNFKGKVIYNPIITNNKITSYIIYGIDGYGNLIKKGDNIFYLSNE